MLSEVMARTLDVGLAGTGAPPMVAPLIVATISASPEILTALRAALANRMQPVVNIALGEVNVRLPHHLHIQALCDVSFRDEQGTEHKGRGVLEQLVAGAHKPSGFTSTSDFAP